MKTNQELRDTAKESGVKLWEIANRLGMSDASFSRMLRYELTPKLKQNIFQIIKLLKVEKEIKNDNKY